MWESLLAWSSVGTGLVAALLWLQSTRIRYVKRYAEIREEERGIWLTTEDPDFREQPFRTSQLQNQLNARAAAFTAGAMLLQAASLVAHQLQR